MKKTLKLVILTISLISGFLPFVQAQKKVEIKKGEININGQKVAEFDSKGGLLSSNRSIWVLSPGTSDTLLTLNEIYKDFSNPLFDRDIFYQINFHDAARTTLFMSNPPGWGAVGEKKILGLIFNDKNPELIAEGKLIPQGLNALKQQPGFDFEKLIAVQEQIQALIVNSHSQLVTRDKSKPISQELTNNRKLIVKLHENSIYNGNKQRILIMQDGKNIGIYEKEIQGGSFPKGIYHIYKFITPVKIGDIELPSLPIATVETTPGVTSSTTGTEISIRILSTGKELKIPAGPYDMAGTAILKALVDNGLL